MLKKTTLCLLLLSVGIFAKAQDKWFIQKLDPKVSIGFPLEPKKLNNNSYGIKDKDEVAYLVSIVDLLEVTKMNLDEFNAQIKTTLFADEFMAGLTPQFPKFKFAPHKIVNVKGYTAYAVSAKSEESKASIYMNIVFVDGIAYSLTSLVPDGKPTKDKDKFLNEIYINK